MHSPSFRLFRTAALLVLAAPWLTAASLEVTASHPDAVYTQGETITWTVAAKDDPDHTLTSVHYKITRDGAPELKQADLQLADGTGEIKGTDTQPGVLLVELDAAATGQPKQHLVGGAIIEPAKIPRSAPRPADFDAFWNGKLAELAKVPANPQLTPGTSGKDGVSYWQITMDLPRDQKVRGHLARPAVGEKFPAILMVQYAGVYGLPPAKITPQAARGWLVLNISAHDLPIDQPEQFYKDQDAGPLKGYAMLGNTDRDQSYFLRMFLACSRAVDYLASRPDWNGQTLVVTGTSQGGLQAIAAAGLNPKVTALIVNVPAGCDVTAPLAGRALPWPYWLKNATATNREAVIRTSMYFDAQNFAPRVKCPALVSFGLLDRTATASGVSVMAAQLAGPVEKLVLTKSEHKDKGGSQAAFGTRSGEWLNALAATGKPPALTNSR